MTLGLELAATFIGGGLAATAAILLTARRMARKMGLKLKP